MSELTRLRTMLRHEPTALMCRFICGGSDIKQGRTCKAWVKSRKEALLSKLKCLFSAFFPFFERCLVLRRSPADDVELPGLEPRTTEPKSAVLPLHHSSIRCSKAVQRYYFFFEITNFAKTLSQKPPHPTPQSGQIPPNCR